MTMGSVVGDVRLDQRLGQLTEQLSAMPVVKLARALTNWTELKAGYRFMNSKWVSHAGIMQTAQAATYERMQVRRARSCWTISERQVFWRTRRWR